MGSKAIMDVVGVSKRFGHVVALSDVSLSIRAGEVTCLLGDNGAGKSTLIKIMAGVFRPTSGDVHVDGKPAVLSTPRLAQDLGIATVHQDVGTLPLMTVGRNFFLGHEPLKGWGPTRRLDRKLANAIALQELKSIGIRRVTSGEQLVGTLSGGEQQALAISRALHFGARLLILDEPTSALGVKEAAVVLRLIQQAREDGIAIVFITHNAHHALKIGDRFAVLIHGSVAAEFGRGERSREEVLDLMAGGEQLESLELGLDEGEPELNYPSQLR